MIWGNDEVVVVILVVLAVVAVVGAKGGGTVLLIHPRMGIRVADVVALTLEDDELFVVGEFLLFVVAVRLKEAGKLAEIGKLTDSEFVVVVAMGVALPQRHPLRLLGLLFAKGLTKEGAGVEVEVVAFFYEKTVQVKI
uniref:Uncharacterized protein n=1 Tax=Glossina pallidipes TaxID=7398 RepID=A0A1A9Z7W7_GLOPL